MRYSKKPYNLRFKILISLKVTFDENKKKQNIKLIITHLFVEHFLLHLELVNLTFVRVADIFSISLVCHTAMSNFSLFPKLAYPTVCVCGPCIICEMKEMKVGTCITYILHQIRKLSTLLTQNFNQNSIVRVLKQSCW